MSTSNLRRRAAAGLLAGTAVTLASVLVAEPSMARVNYAYSEANVDHAFAEIYVDGGTQGRAYAQHGGSSAMAGWATSHALASADSGVSNSFSAWTQSK